MFCGGVFLGFGSCWSIKYKQFPIGENKQLIYNIFILGVIMICSWISKCKCKQKKK